MNAAALAVPVKSDSPSSVGRRRFARRFRATPPAIVGVTGVVLVLFVAVAGPWLAPSDPSAPDYASLLQRPLSGGHLLGTDELGRDLLSRLIIGTRASLVVGLTSTAIALLIAIPLGLFAGYYRGWLDAVVSRILDVVLAFPFLVLAVGLAAVLGPSLMNATIAIAVVQIPAFARIARAEALGLREQEYVQAALINGVSHRTILRRHILPNCVSPLLVQATIAIPGAIIGEAVLSYLGLGVQPPTPAWGTMLSDGQSLMSEAPWLTILPGVAIAFTTLSFNLFGDGLRDVLDLRTKV